jgi:subtilisin family serine protease
MNTARLVAILTLAATLAVPTSADARPHEPIATGPAGLVEAIVVLGAQADLTPARWAGRKDRPGAMAKLLRSHADRTQRGLRDLLERRRREGLVGYIEPLWIVDAIAVSATPAVIRELAARSDVREIRPNATVAAPQTLATDAPPEPNLDLVNAPAMWDLGYRGQGVVVANMDTGVDVTHPDLAGRWRGGTNSWYDPNGQHATPTDVNGHGTWTMGVMVGGSAGGTAVGVAPDAQWIAVKIFNDQGSATTAHIHQGFQWLLDPDGNPATADAPDVVNNSWTMSNAGCLLDFEPDLVNLRAAGILPVFAAGNYGPSDGGSRSPANNPEAFAVGATNDLDVIDASSSRGPGACGQSTYPQVVAPGVGVHTTDLYGLYADESGTSVAAPHVAGALALLLQAVPNLPADRQAAALEAGAIDLGAAGPDNTYGYGRLDVLAAYRWLGSAPDFTVVAAGSSASTAPGGGVSYDLSFNAVNAFSGDVSLALTGLTAAQASWTFTPGIVTGGTGSARLTLSTSGAIAAGTYPLTVTATSGPTVHTIPLTLVVTAPADFALTAAPASRTAVAGNATTYTIGVSSLNGFADVVGLSVTGLPASVGTAVISPASIAGAGSASLTVTTASASAAGTFPLTITGTAGGLTHTVVVTLTVTPRDFTLAVTPSAFSVTRRQSATYTATINIVGGSVGGVTLAITGLPAGATATISPNPSNSPGSATVTVRTTLATPRGTFALRITGTAGGLSHDATVALTVR